MHEDDDILEIYTENTDSIFHKMTKINNRISLFQSHIFRLQKELEPYERQLSFIKVIRNND